MKLTIVGCSGSYPGPDSPASCYLLEAPFEGRTYRLILDLGNGALGGLQRILELADIDAIALSHLHPDHCMDICGLYVASAYDPRGPLDRIPIIGPEGTAEYLAGAYGISEPAGMTGQFDFFTWDAEATSQFGPFELSVLAVDHPIPAYAIKVECGGRTLVYSGDTGPFEPLVEFARDADVFLCEASFLESVDNPPNLHLTGAEAADYAQRADVGRLLVTHIPAWNDRAEVEADVKSVNYTGEVVLVTAGSVFDI